MLMLIVACDVIAHKRGSYKMENNLKKEKLDCCESEKNIVEGKSSFFKRNGLKILFLFLLFLGILLFSASIWYTNTFSDVGFDAVIFTIFSPLAGAQPGIVYGFLKWALLPSVLSLVILIPLFFCKFGGKISFFPLSKKIIAIFSGVLSVSLIVFAAFNVGLPEYIYNVSHESNFFEEYYVNPDDVSIKFPEKKRNLIYIFLESMETTYLSKQEGGAMEHNLIPELYELASENINFSHNDDVGGFVPTTGGTWTIAAITSQTAGIPLKAGLFERNEFGKDSFLAGAKNITTILKDNGYYQALMFGSDASFANRDVYYKDHGIDAIYDLFTARSDGIVPEDYHVWWGMEDLHLFEYAKQKLLEISQKEQPFAFTMLTVDTHHVAGYKCELCEDTYSEQYDNVISCSSKQVYEFIDWIKQQSFYENTTIVICGDHLTMDGEYIERNVESDYEQHIYNCIINSEKASENYKNREFCGMDMFPTTLVAMGCEIPGDRLGLGTNLFSDTPTLIEELGYETFDEEISFSSEFYVKNFIANEVSVEE